MRFLKSLLCAAVCCAVLAGCAAPAGSDSSRPDFTGVPENWRATADESVAPADYRAVWISYLEWPLLDTSSSDAFTASVGALLDNCKGLGLNTVIVQVRPFADAIYPSTLFPWSHLVTGVQGQAPDFDPLAIFVSEAHARDLSIEAWFNPYRVSLNDQMPPALAQSGLTATHPEWVKEATGGLYLDPSRQDVMDYICAGVDEVVRNYQVDGVQFDDYFYPTTEESFDLAEFQASGTTLSLEDWRRDNVNRLVQQVYQTVHTAAQDTGRTLRFGISPQGNNDNNYNTQYSDVGLWMSTPGYVDYVMPQVYWGFDYRLQSGSDQYAFANIVNQWAAMPRAEGVSLYFGLGAYRIGGGDGSSAPSGEWTSGRNLADMARSLAKNGYGYSLYRYASLFANSAWPDLAAAECASLRQANGV